MKILAFGYFLIQFLNAGREESLQITGSCSSMAPPVPVSHLLICNSGIVCRLTHRFKGKSTLAKTIVRHQKQKEASAAPRRSFLAYFFFKHNATDRRTARSMLQHVIMQLVNADETTMRLAHE